MLGRKSADIDQCIHESDIILFSVPIREFKNSLKLVSKIDLKEKILVDMSSVLLDHLNLLKKFSPNVGFIHLMFGPDVVDIKNKNIIISNEMNDGRHMALIDVFKKEQANITETSSNHHDYMVSIVQSLSQFSSITLAKTISEMDTSKKELDAFSSVTFSLNKESISRIVNQNPELWAAIQFNSIYIEKILDQHTKNIKLFKKYIKEKNYEKFSNTFSSMVPFWRSEE
ncbi:MAG: prephenate dehydrogenase/arogenate dehydrogenase family protein [Candidatus Pacebacteria bacterium]|nr:prephenate dehydrogenase/arogenate dehydrogenase family protein [Candidatus Paceibacterota bacterium]